MPNARRGEVGLTLGQSRYTLCLTLGALAELESAFAAPDLIALGERFASGRISSRDLVVLLAAALRGGGHPLSDEEVAALPLHEGIEPVVQALVALLTATFGSASENPREPQHG